MLMTPREGAEQKVTAAGRSAGLLRDFLSRNTRKELDSFACRLYGHAATSPRQRNEIRDLRCTGVWRSLVARKFWVLQVAGSNPAAPTIPRGSRERRSDERTYLPADEERHAIGCSADQILAVRIRAGKAARGRAADGLDELERHEIAGAALLCDEGRGDRLCRAQRHCLQSGRAAADRAPHHAICRQFQAEPRAAVDALKAVRRTP